MTHQHTWTETGILTAGAALIQLCKDPKCTAYLETASRVQFGLGMSINGIELDIDDDPVGGVAKLVCVETACELPQFESQPGDVFIDIGAHVGVVSIYLALAHPWARVIAVEPIAANVARLRRNIEANEVTDRVVVVDAAVTCNGRNVSFGGEHAKNTGGMSMLLSGGDWPVVGSVTLADLFEKYVPNRCRLLKIDCEGAEYEILQNADPDLLKRIDVLWGEFHENNRTERNRLSADDLKTHCRQFIPEVKVATCRMADA